MLVRAVMNEASGMIALRSEDNNTRPALDKIFMQRQTQLSERLVAGELAAKTRRFESSLCRTSRVIAGVAVTSLDLDMEGVKHLWGSPSEDVGSRGGVWG